ncbi:bifunctional nicotinamidase/pyrazinamidase [Larsenimonas rhizosphaerae]|uniref:nicotinamidase n=1 Tax=Larsenimonas rhizosphaerae TaxID=2944682 RepID=A0AA42CY11_9GAMM|nr:bifunctional nicotinamidase/pyrazinamidase [Larsenimonas rhizosphaerae]MCX2524540.1 bifunctional nicotinamidase/pyrazinamidase [Larsenimonas rhizosphaerae]
MSHERALILVDVQPDFMAGGPLACHDGEAVVAGINAAMNSGRYGHIVATQDWHPAGHLSFAERHPGKAPFDTMMLHGECHTLWPAHCVQGTPGAAIHPGIDQRAIDVIIRKGTHPEIDSYSAFRNNTGPDGQRRSTGLAGWLEARGVREVYLCGLARDVCVLWSAEDSRYLGFQTHVLWSLTRPVTPESDQATKTRLQAGGITVTDRD